MNRNTKVALLPLLALATFPIFFLIGASNGLYRVFAVLVLASGIYSVTKTRGRILAVPVFIMIIGALLVFIFFSEPTHIFQFR